MSGAPDKDEDMTRTVTFLHSSDLQIGMTRWFLSEEAQSRFDDDRIRSIEELGRVATERDCDFIVLAGDVFEHNSLSARTTGRALEALKALPVPVFLLPGNHDPYTADSIFRRTEGIPGVHVLSDAEVSEILPGVELVGAPLLSKTATTDPVAQALAPLTPTAAIRIAVGHGQAESRSSELKPDQIDLGTVAEKLLEGSIDYLALGDTHSTACLDAAGRVWFSGAPETTDFHDLDPARAGGEIDSGNVLVVEVEKPSVTEASVTVTPVPVGKWTFEALSRELTSDQDIAEFLATLRAYPDKARTVIKYGLQGTLTLSQHNALEEGLAELEEVFASLKPRERTTDLHLEPGEQELADLAVSGYAAAVLRELVDSVSRSEPHATASQTDRDALNLMFRLSREG